MFVEEPAAPERSGVVRQARALGTALRLLPTDDIVWATSPLTRAMQTCLLAMEAAGRSPLADTTLGDEVPQPFPNPNPTPTPTPWRPPAVALSPTPR